MTSHAGIIVSLARRVTLALDGGAARLLKGEFVARRFKPSQIGSAARRAGQDLLLKLGTIQMNSVKTVPLSRNALLEHKAPGDLGFAVNAILPGGFVDR